MPTITIDPAADTTGPFADNRAYVEWVVAQAVSSWQRQYPGASKDGAITAARLAHNATYTDEAAGPAIPLEVTARQARLALLGAGLDGAVDAAINAMPAGPAKRAAQITWEYSLNVQRFHPLITTMGSALQLTEAQIDALFVAAAKI